MPVGAGFLLLGKSGHLVVSSKMNTGVSSQSSGSTSSILLARVRRPDASAEVS